MTIPARAVARHLAVRGGRSCLHLTVLYLLFTEPAPRTPRRRTGEESMSGTEPPRT